MTGISQRIDIDESFLLVIITLEVLERVAGRFEERRQSRRREVFLVSVLFNLGIFL